MGVTEFSFVGSIPLSPGETVAAMTVWNALGRDCIVVATSEGRMFVFRVNKDGTLDVAGPLKWGLG